MQSPRSARFSCAELPLVGSRLRRLPHYSAKLAIHRQQATGASPRIPTSFFALTQRTKQEKSRQNEPPASPGKPSAFCLAHPRCVLEGSACAYFNTLPQRVRSKIKKYQIETACCLNVVEARDGVSSGRMPFLVTFCGDKK